MTALALAVSALTLLQAGPGLEPGAPAVATVAEAPDPADRLAEDAYRLFADRRTWSRAARLLERSAAMRTVEDPKRAASFLEAGRVYVHVGAYDDALRTFGAAAEAAIARGAVAVAAHAYLDAAIAAARTGDRAGALALLDRGALLAGSPHLDAVQRAAILSRIPEDAPSRG